MSTTTATQNQVLAMEGRLIIKQHLPKKLLYFWLVRKTKSISHWNNTEVQAQDSIFVIQHN